ncbi:MAG: hypothetical protein H8E55_64630 [Pelagibacterales bacterium]|nr:hypothetical protein [Pelagibacterales bacterium]
MIGFRKYWYGKECEGRLTDVETLFITDISAKGIDMEKVPHIYFCSAAVQQLVDSKGNLDWEWMNKFIDRTNITISLEVTPGMLKMIPAMIRIKTHIMFMLNEEEISLLKQNDSIKVIYDDYSLYCTSIQNMQKVTPDDYKYDRFE